VLKTKDLAVSRLAQIWCRRAGFGAVLERDISLHPPPPSAGLGAGAIGAWLQAKQAQHVRASLVRCLACQVDIEATSNFRDPHPSALKLDRPSEVLKFDAGGGDQPDVPRPVLVQRVILARHGRWAEMQVSPGKSRCFAQVA